ncbi:MAG: LLM class flavin-dependent oxidoreductase [Chloroflexi bacterium]|nr:LLM class flavin-dependent oxidoreductase [Chloroflexota bacterium]
MMKLSLQMHSLRSMNEWVDLACRAEELGFAEIHIAERLDFPYPTWPTLFLMAEHTTRIGLGTGVTNPYSRHPAVTAKMIAMLDAYSRGRASPGIGQGDLWQFDQLGIDHDRPLAALREAVLVIRHILSGKDDGFPGEVFSIQPGLDFKWKAYREYTPIFVGSRSPGGMAVAGEVGDELHLPNCVSPEFVALAKEQVRKGMQKAGRTLTPGPSPRGRGELIPLASSPQCGVSLDREAAVRHCQERIGGFIEWMKVPCELMGIGQDEVARLSQAKRSGDRDYLHRNVTPRYMQAFAVAGTPQAVIEQLETLAGLGLDHVTLNEPGPNLDEALELLGKEVLPYFSHQ